MAPNTNDNTEESLSQEQATEISEPQEPARSSDEESVNSAVTAPIQFQVEGESHLGRYELRGRIGAGGMGEVYRAHDPLLDRPVAIKVIGQLVQNEADMLERFAREARAASALNHPNIITVYDLGQHDGHPFIVMELVEGQSLQDRLEEPLSTDELIDLGTQIVDGLAAAHEAGIVHRDLKPGNILIDQRGNVRILDFGVAAIRERSSGAEQGEATALLTSSGNQIVGTVGYMAPEILRGEPVDHRSDQFALGIVLYEMATGERPFKRSSRAQILVATLEEQPEPLAKLRQDLPAPLREIIERCLNKRPEKRYAETKEILTALKAVRSAPIIDRARRRGELPSPATPLWGRERELRQLRELLQSGRVRLLTLTGVGGSGKTRLAIEVARATEAQYPGGVIFVSLGPIQDADLVAPAIATAFGGTEAEGGQELPELLAALSESEGPIMLVLDNFEQVIGAAPAVGELLELCPQLTILATSREVLHLRGEYGYPVTPLPLPTASTSLSVESALESPAVALFVERAQAAKPDFELDEKNLGAVLELCRRLDGLPLALELAAARVRTFSLGAMLKRLQSRLELLSGGPRDLPARQQTLRATLHWSYELLDEVEQAAFRRLAAFVGGFTLDAAEAVIDPFSNLDRSTIDLLESLHNQSLLLHAAESEIDDDPRFTMLEIIREYAVDVLRESEHEPATRKAHAAYFLVLAEEGEAALSTGESSYWLERFQLEEANFRVALDWLIANDEGEWGLRMALGLFHYWQLGEGRAEGKRRFLQLLSLPSAQGDSVLRARALFATGILTDFRADVEFRIKVQNECLEIYRRLGDLQGQAVALNALGIIHSSDAGDLEKAHECLEESLELWKKLDESDGYARSLSNFASLLRIKGEGKRSRELYREAAEVFQRLGDPVSAAWELSHEAGMARDHGDPEAEQLYESTLESFRQHNEPWGIATTLLDLGRIKQESGQGELAYAHYCEALGLFCRVGHQRGIARIFEAVATLVAERGDDDLVLRLAGAAEALRRRIGNPPVDAHIKPALETAVATARQHLDDASAKKAWRRGQEEPVSRLIEELCESQK